MKKLFDKIKIFVIAAISLPMVTSCLEKYPSSAIPENEAMQTVNDAEQLVNGIYATLKSGALYSGYLTLLPDIQSDMVMAVDGNSNTYGSFWRWTVRSTDSEIEAVYGSLYAVIGNCNFFLDNVENLKSRVTDDDDLDLLDIYTGEVLALRAMCYSDLLKLYCKAYDPATAAQNPGIVIRSKYYDYEPVVRASLEDSYAFVVSDLEKAESLLSDEEEDNVASSIFFSLSAAQALHARVALYMQDWDKAIEYSSKLINGRKSSYQLSSVRGTAPDGASLFDYMWAYDVGTEVIWRIGFTSTSYGGALGQVFLNFTNDYTYYYPDYVPTQAVLNSFENGDERDDSYFADFSQGIEIGYSNGMTWPVLVKYYGNRSLVASYIYHVSMPKVFRLAEQYLIRAEAYCRTSQYAKASDDLTTLRHARFTSGGGISVNDGNWLKTIADERMKELFMEGFRLHDLKRWGQEYADVNDGYSINRVTQIYAQKEGSELKILPDNPLFVWPIPQHEIEAPGANLTPNESN